ncbi:MAG: holo-ACP synthase [Deltaproteobacteria bacterium]
MLIGIDIIEIERIKEAALRTPHFLERLYTVGELEYCRSKANPYPSLAARFAAKEAVRKLHPALSQGIGFHDVEVAVEAGGRPRILLHGAALLRSEQEGIRNIDLSLSHSATHAIAAVIAEKE